MDTDKIVLTDHVLLRCVTDLRSFRHICDLLVKHYPNLKAVAVEQELVNKLSSELFHNKDDIEPLAGHWLIVYTRGLYPIPEEPDVIRDWNKWRMTGCI